VTIENNYISDHSLYSTRIIAPLKICVMTSTVALLLTLLSATKTIAASDQTSGSLWLPEKLSETRTNTPAANNAPPPLGTLWLPGTSAEAPTVNSPAPASTITLPQSGFRLPVQPAAQTNAVNASDQRPLGVLFNPSTPLVVSTKPTAPKATQPGIQNAPSPLLKSIPQNTSGSFNRTEATPLGILWAPAATIKPSAQPVNAVKSVTQTNVQSVPSTIPTNKAPTTATGEPAIGLSADTLTYDKGLATVKASGNVEILYGDRTLRADTIIYNQKDDLVTATGRVSLSAPDSETVFGEYMKISGDLKDAVIRNIGIILTDRSRIAGSGARRSNANVTELRNGVYSPCNLCANDPTKAPLWQVKAVKVVHDKEAQTVVYRDAWLEFYGIPVLYSPYFQHPDPTVKRQSGFLFPSIGGSNDLGTIVKTPYFWNISDNEDVTATPIFTSEEGPSLALEHRKKLLNGSIETTASIADNDNSSGFTTSNGIGGIRGHILSKGRFDINPTWRWGYDLNRASDDTYMRRYGYGSPQSLDSQLFVEGFRGANYFSARSYAFQNLSTTSDDQSPVVLPLVDYNFVGRKDRFGGHTELDANFLSLTRNAGNNTQRLSLRPSWIRPYTGPIGDVYRFSLGLKGDFYNTNSLVRSGFDKTYSGLSGRLVPEAMLKWRMPFARTNARISQVIEPIASIVVSPYGGNSTKIPNEDSREVELDETNLFSNNRFNGIDRVEGGPRINYGLKWGVYGAGGGFTETFIGQTYRLKSDNTFSSGTGLDDNFSDVVASITASPNQYLDVYYRTRFKGDTISPNRNEFNLSAGVPALRGNLNYIFLDQEKDSEFAGREEFTASLNSQVNRFWKLNLSGIRDMASEEMRALSFAATYENECVLFETRASRTFFEDRDLKPTDQITFTLVLKTLGEVRTGFSGSN